MRLRQVVLVTAELDPVARDLRRELGLGEPFADPGVAEFGLRNAVFALGDRFVEVVSPTRPEAPAARYLERNGEGGYMVIFQLDDLEAARTRASDLGIRVVWQIDLPDIAGTHLHPADMRGAIVSLDRADPRDSWRWGGPDWTGRAGRGAPGAVTGATIAVDDPRGVAERWASVLGVSASDRLAVEAGSVGFVNGDGGLVEVEVAVPEEVRRGREAVEVGGVRFALKNQEVQA